MLQRRLQLMQNSYFTPVELWPSVRRELECFLGLMITLVASWELQWNGVACATDACEEGFGVCLRALGPDIASRYGRVRERERFRHPEHVRARDAALLDACSLLHRDSFETLGAVGAQGLKASAEFEEISASDLADDAWHVCGGWPFSFDESSRPELSLRGPSESFSLGQVAT